ARWYDTLLDTPCQWNGTIGAHCLPTSLVDGTFADAACTIPAVRGTPTWAPAFARVGRPTSGLFAVTATPGSGYFIDAGTSTCKPLADGQTYYPLGAAAPDAMFVAGGTVQTPIGDGLSLVEVVGDDGSRQTYDLVTTSDGVAC